MIVDNPASNKTEISGTAGAKLPVPISVLCFLLCKMGNEGYENQNK